MRSVALDKGDGFIDRIHYLYGENQVQVFRIPIGLGCGTGIAQHATGSLVSANLHAGLLEPGRDGRQKALRDSRVHEHGFHRVAHRGTAALGVEANLFGHLEVGGAIHVSVAEPVKMREQRHRGSLERVLERLSAAGNDEVD